MFMFVVLFDVYVVYDICCFDVYVVFMFIASRLRLNLKLAVNDHDDDDTIQLSSIQFISI
ncbi:MAG: hypothetical protein VX933_05160 [Bacteroidota bacterium]|nr:hypothetical protein [Bacteroidota bacterium]